MSEISALPGIATLATAAAAAPLFPWWLGMTMFATALAAFRKATKTYRLLLAYIAVSWLGYATSGLAAGTEGIGPAVLFVMIAVSRAVLAPLSSKTCDGLPGKAWTTASYAAAGLVAAIGVATPFAGAASAWLAGAASALVALHALLSAAVFARIAPKSQAAPIVAAGFLAAGLAWAFAAVVSLGAPLGAEALAALAAYSRLAGYAAEALLGLATLLASMTELARPAPEDTALDDYVTKMSASVRRFIPTEFMQHLDKRDFLDLRLGDHVKKDMTIFFSDIRAFTELSERLTPEESFAFINSYLSRVVPVVTSHGGFVDKYMGDAIMALFSAEGSADAAVECAVEMQKRMVEYNGHRAKMAYRPISMGIGIHTGPLMLGVVGVTDRMEGTVISDAVNLSSRLQSIAKAFNIPLVISESTFMQLEDAGKYKYRFIGKVKVKGKDAPVSAFEIFDGLPDEQFERKMRANTFFEQGMLAYYQKDYSQGVFYFKRALEDVHEDGAARFYLETCLRKTMAPKASEKGA